MQVFHAYVRSKALGSINIPDAALAALSMPTYWLATDTATVAQWFGDSDLKELPQDFKPMEFWFNFCPDSPSPLLDAHDVAPIVSLTIAASPGVEESESDSYFS